MKFQKRKSDDGIEEEQLQSEKLKLESAKLEIESKKIGLESALLEYQLSNEGRSAEKIKLWASMASVFIAAIAVVGGFGSFIKWIHEDSKARQLHVEERLDTTLKTLASRDENLRLSAITSLRSFLVADNNTQNKQVLTAIVENLAIENVSELRRALVTFMTDVNTDVIDKATLDSTLSLLAERSRGIVKDGVVISRRPRFAQDFDKLKENDEIKSNGDVKNIGANLQAIADVIVVLLRKGAHTNDLHGIYLGHSNLDNIQLANTSFDDSILTWSTFNNAKLTGDSFRDADLEQTEFILANLEGAKFVASNPRPHSIKTNYVLEQMNRSIPNQVQIYMPDFTCADLRNADFKGHPLFAMTENSVSQSMLYVSPAYFSHADLSGADFSAIRVFSLLPDTYENQIGNAPLPFPFMGFVGAHQHKDQYIAGIFGIKFDQFPEGATKIEKIDNFSGAFLQISASLSGSNWRNAKFPKFLKYWWEKNPAPGSNDVGPSSPYCKNYHQQIQ